MYKEGQGISVKNGEIRSFGGNESIEEILWLRKEIKIIAKQYITVVFLLLTTRLHPSN